MLMSYRKNLLKKEKLLVIAPSVPYYDWNSGDVRLFAILKILSSSYEITYLAQNKAQNGFEEDKYIFSLKHLGINVLFGQDCSVLEILRKSRFRAAILEFYSIAEYYLRRIRILQPSCFVIIDTVDIHFLRAYLKYKITKNKNDLIKADEIKRRELDIYKKADLVITVTDEDGKTLKENDSTLVLCTVPNIHDIVSPNKTPEKKGLIFVGGFTHDPNVDAVLYFCSDVLPIVREMIPDIKFTIVGSNPPEQVKGLNNDFINITGYVPSTTPYLWESYISVAPLRYGAGMKGKIGEAMAHGLPVVTTSIGAQGMGLLNRENAMIADSPEDFARAVIELIQNEGLYKMIQYNVIEHIKNNYTPMQVEKKIDVILEKLDNLPLRKMSIFEKTCFLSGWVMNYLSKRVQAFITR